MTALINNTCNITIFNTKKFQIFHIFQNHRLTKFSANGVWPYND